MFQTIYFEISGTCNAVCPWCQTGLKIRESRSRTTVLDLPGLPRTSRQPKQFIEYDTFVEAICYLREKKILVHDVIVNLYNWGEPFLHPQFAKLLSFLHEENVKVGLSTNGSKPVYFNHASALEHVEAITFSVPGFSQASYSRIYGFKFDKIKQNIQLMLENYRSSGFRGQARLAYHVYQFNMHELSGAVEFARQNKMNIHAYYALFAGYTMFKEYLTSAMPYEQLQQAAQELMLHYIDDQIKSIPKNYRCPQFEDILAIDENCNVLTCCAVGKELKDYSIGNLFDLELEDILKLKLSQPICKECMALGLSHLFHNVRDVLVEFAPESR